MKGTQSWMSPLCSNEEQTGATWRGRKWPIILFIFPRHKSQQKQEKLTKIFYLSPTPQKSTKNMKFEANNDIDNVNIVIINICSLFSTKGPPTGKKKAKKNNKEGS